MKVQIGDVFGPEGQLVVVGKVKIKRNISCLVKCSICEKDSEMFGDGVFTVRPASLLDGRLPCGCRNGHAYTEEQWNLRCERACSAKGYTFLGTEGVFVGSNTVCRILCNKDGHTWKAPVSSLCNRSGTGTGCKHCADKALEAPEEETVDRVLATGKFAEGSRFWKTGERNTGGNMIWNVYCPVCANDEYSKAGLCNGEFKSTATMMLYGSRPCRCEPKHVKTPAQAEFQLRSLCQKHGVEFLGWVGEYTVHTKSKFKIWCNKHGVSTVSVCPFIRSSKGCRRCSLGGYKPHLPGYVYVLKAASDTGGFTGYGITNHIKRRLRNHERNLLEAGYSIEDLLHFELDGQTPPIIEKAIMRDFVPDSQDIEGFKKEATAYESYDDVVAFVQSKLQEISNATQEQPCEA